LFYVPFYGFVIFFFILCANFLCNENNQFEYYLKIKWGGRGTASKFDYGIFSLVGQN